VALLNSYMPEVSFGFDLKLDNYDFLGEKI